MEQKRSILVIEDDKISRTILANKLKEEYIVYQAENGEEGLTMLRKHPTVSVILLDILMPVMDGYEFLHIIKQNDAYSLIPVIVITGNFSEEEEMKCLELGANDFLSKPYNPAEALVRIHNIIRLEEASNALQEMEKDELTGLFTKQAFLRYATEMVEQNPDTDFAILGFNIENFKATNSQYGERMCDEFLAYIGAKVRRVIKTGISGRFSGDQFVVLFDNDEKNTIDRIEQISRVVFQHAPIPHQVAKIGVYAPIDRNIEMARCCDRAFLAIREVKGVYHKNVAFYEEKMREQMINEQRIQDSMEKALAEEQFMVYYQPKHESISGEIAGAEALIRWNHPEFGFMQPNKFVPLFERNGFITELDSFVLKRVCEDIQRWQEKGIPVVPISVNVSRRDYLEEGWIDRQIEMIDKYGINHSLIHMEVTESLYAENTGVIIEQIHKLQKNDFLIEMDDFGAGYSSLGMLATFPLDVIKLDISFVRSIEINKVVIENIIKLAHKMGFKTVAEGAETEAQFHILRNLGCDFIQGYYFAKPLSCDKYEKYVTEKMNLLEQVGDALNRMEISVPTTELEKSRENMRINSLLSIIESLEEANFIDSLTGFQNRKAFYNSIQSIENSPQLNSMPIGIAFVDINGLKSVNDNFGHEAGDRLIVHIAGILRSIFLTADIFRVGGDEFIILSRESTEREFYDKIRRVNSRWTEEESAAVGFIWLMEARNLEQHMVAVDKQMYKEKRKYYEQKFNDRRRGQSRGKINESMDASLPPLFDDIANALPCGFFVYQAEGDERLVLYNDELVRLFGCSGPEDFNAYVNGSFRGMVHPDDLAMVEGNISEQINEENDVDYVEYRIIAKDGTVKKVRDHGRFIHSEDYGNVFVVMVNEIK
ncbi:MAG: EAL domain-containing protein [Agathobacter sp.]|uniref:EAL domain-containing protein n=1 Tax=Agathobacter sp. TaxID=2021311 RepID=UPI002583120C|nr:EAL domain-containing protein [Agathobacter sp.]MCR5677447.1 EAL domain-containing protein [Agathobacter sp.]